MKDKTDFSVPRKLLLSLESPEMERGANAGQGESTKPLYDLTYFMFPSLHFLLYQMQKRICSSASSWKARTEWKE